MALRQALAKSEGAVLPGFGRLIACPPEAGTKGVGLLYNPALQPHYAIAKNGRFRYLIKFGTHCA
jgi:hypothetical protein